MDRKIIKNQVKEIFLNLFQKYEGNLQDNYCVYNFFGSKIGLLPGDVVAYLYAVEKEFGFQVPTSYILEGRFNTLDNVTDIICEILQKAEN